MSLCIKCDVRGCGKVESFVDEGIPFVGTPAAPEGWRIVHTLEDGELSVEQQISRGLAQMLPPAAFAGGDLPVLRRPRRPVTKHICPDHEMPDTRKGEDA